VAATWTASGRSVSSVQAGTEAAPTLSTDGLDLTGIHAVTVWLDAGAGQTITSDAGQVDLYQRDSGLWAVAPAVVMPVPPGSSGLRRVQLGTVRIDNPRGRLAPIANGVTVSGASLTIEALVTAVSHLGGIPA
jgi:hypothetical protein